MPESQQNDGYLVHGYDQLRKYTERLSQPGAQNIVLLQLNCLQPTFLETYARTQWLQHWVPCKRKVNEAFPVDKSVIGAFTGDLDAPADLHQVGIPLWLVRPLADYSAARIDRVVAPLDEDWNSQLPIWDSFSKLNVSQSDPPHPVIYTGLPSYYKCYARAIFIHQQFSVLGLGHRNPALKLGSAAAKPAAIEALDVTKCEYVSRLPQVKRARTDNESSGTNEQRNQFLVISHQAYPRRLQDWATAHTRLGELEWSTGPSLLEYALPDPVVFITPINTLKTSFPVKSPAELIWVNLEIWHISDLVRVCPGTAGQMKGTIYFNLFHGIPKSIGVKFTQNSLQVRTQCCSMRLS
ncbi:hypothetical protein BDP27DRAFT_1429318 [Rhodocollybia butyracea]|uniref:Uncharacterized protein n=1 Tax=Rhodocollybia butyracea TaxID=206335 RepID=A0A9P5PFE8_9AGAR|nr:hypothetical protein BDP27DRAFT_1429318 [Rhodocollybia butyracea]